MARACSRASRVLRSGRNLPGQRLATGRLWWRNFLALQPGATACRPFRLYPSAFADQHLAAV